MSPSTAELLFWYKRPVECSDYPDGKIRSDTCSFVTFPTRLESAAHSRADDCEIKKLTGWVVPPMSMGVLRFCEDAGSHLVLALRRGVFVGAEGEAGGTAGRS